MASSPSIANQQQRRKEGKKGKRKPDLTESTVWRVALRPSSPAPDFPRTKEAVLRVALKTALTGGEFIDTRIYAYSRRTVSGGVDHPLPVYANSETLTEVSNYFDTVLSGGFAESSVNSLDADSLSGETGSADEYEYYSDSDLEDEDVPADAAASTHPLGRVDGAGDDAAVVAGDEADRAISSAGGEIEVTGALSLFSLSNSHNDTSTSSQAVPTVDSTRRYGRTVFMKNMAYKTLRAFIFYVFTGEIKFAPLKSQLEHENGRQPEAADNRKAPTPPPCSPKSMYRLAHMCDIKELQELALNDIKSKLSSKNILDEFLSAFTSRYTEIKKAELDFLMKDEFQPDVSAAIPRLVAHMVKDGVPHATLVITALLEQFVASHNGNGLSGSQLRKELSDTKASLDKVKRCPNGHIRSTQVQIYCSSCGANHYVNFASI
ncbi:uncharacterized protein FIBRA_01882 [Fibroporia radiculosa]|uniref:BTB domain-containing protein n=1 Tax=Fibroporia radiculosa TaxID=599839 RepID=J4HU13_9APHY|nr:uncharacterized protein FIBRA_01882 [Fibroporia radiculosa]CCL99857.1 predicted protein [Fibroporia radiculosa]